MYALRWVKRRTPCFHITSRESCFQKKADSVWILSGGLHTIPLVDINGTPRAHTGDVLDYKNWSEASQTATLRHTWQFSFCLHTVTLTARTDSLQHCTVCMGVCVHCVQPNKPLYVSMFSHHLQEIVWFRACPTAHISNNPVNVRRQLYVTMQ